MIIFFQLVLQQRNATPLDLPPPTGYMHISPQQLWQTVSMYTNRYTLIARPAFPPTPHSSYPSFSFLVPISIPHSSAAPLSNSLRHKKSAKRVKLECCPQIVLVVRRPRRTCCQSCHCCQRCQSIYQFVGLCEDKGKESHKITLYRR